jgi:hypothetical protein
MLHPQSTIAVLAIFGQDGYYDQAMSAGHAIVQLIEFAALLGSVAYAFAAFLFWRIFDRAGLPGPLGLIALLPFIGPVLCLCILAFSAWKVVPLRQTVAVPYASSQQPPPPDTTRSA